MLCIQVCTRFELQIFLIFFVATQLTGSFCRLLSMGILQNLGLWHCQVWWLTLPSLVQGTWSWLPVTGQDRNMTQSARPLVRESTGSPSQWLSKSASESDSDCQSTRAACRLTCELQVDNRASLAPGILGVFPINKSGGGSCRRWHPAGQRANFYGPPADSVLNLKIFKLGLRQGHSLN